MEGYLLPLLVAVAAIILLFVSLTVVNAYQEGVVLTLGRYTSTRRPGLNLVLPVLQTMIRVDMRLTVTEVEPQDVITKDNVSARVTAVVYFRVTNAQRAVIDVANYRAAIAQLSQVTLRSTLGAHSLDEMLRQQAVLQDHMRATLDARTERWGVAVESVEIRSIDLEGGMIRAMAQEAEAERGKRARIITAEGELDAAEKLAAAARKLDGSPGALTLRTLATLKEIGAEQNSTIIAYPISFDSGALSAALARSVAAPAAAETPKAQ